MTDPYDVRWSGRAHRSVAERLPESVAAAIFELVRGPLCVDPRRVGKPLQAPMEGLWSARRATYRVIYRIDEDKHLVVIEAVMHRRDAYRPERRPA